jgi:hypothetical protein
LLELLADSGTVSSPRLRLLFDEANQLMAIIAASMNTARATRS